MPRNAYIRIDFNGALLMEAEVVRHQTRQITAQAVQAILQCDHLCRWSAILAFGPTSPFNIPHK
jgi:hypothetical protein